ncbi:MAG TPA: D-aminoacyl-tRNA deacylase [bacterium]|nr:D-aminoacyl-tRNA deacylase [bacterium]
MRALVQRVRRAAVYVVEDDEAAGGPPGTPAGQIGRGFAVLLGVSRTDTPADARSLAGRVATLRVFGDAAGRLNRSVTDVGGEVLSIPQFTLYADTAGGRRPSFVEAAPPEQAEPLYRLFNETLAASGVPVVPGRFRTHMIVEIHNDGPVTVMLETERPVRSGPPGASR